MPRSRSASWMRLLAASSRLSLGLLSLGVGTASLAADREAATPSRERLASDASAMTRLFHEKMGALPEADTKPYMRLDLGDPAQYDFVLHRLQAAGNTPDNSPRLFASLAKARALARRGGEPSKAQQDCLSFITLEEQPLPGTLQFRSSAQVSCFGNDGFLFSDLTAFQADASFHNLSVLDRHDSEEFGTHVGASERASLSFTYRYEKDRLLQLDSLVLAFEQGTGAALAAYSTAATSGYPESGPGGVAGYTAQDPSLTLQSPKDLLNGVNPSTGLTETVIRVCLNRGLIQAGNVDCDYASVVKTATGSAMYPLNGDYYNSPAPYGLGAVDAAASAASGSWVGSSTVFQASPGYDTTRTYIPLQFTYNAGATTEGPCTVTSYEPAYTKALLTMVQTDSPRCGVAPGTVLGSSSLSLPTGGQYIGLGRLIDFGQICVDYEKTVKLTVQVGAKATCGTSTNLLRYKTVVVSPIQYRNSCFARGTPVVRADGQPDAIENFKVGDKLIANDKGLVLTVTGVSRGVERSAMVRLKDDKGHDALVTLTHPVVTTNRGIVRAEELKVNDRLVTREGTSVLTSLTRELYQDTVYNLAVGTPEELAKAGPEARTLYAGGILMGDYHMQAGLEAKRARPSAAQASIPAGWRVDYVKSQASGSLR